MQQGLGELVELSLEDGLTGGRLLCPPVLVPAPGQYLQAHDTASSAPLSTGLFSAGQAPGGFLVAPPLPPAWRPGMELALRGPCGRGFSPPDGAQRVALLALGVSGARLLPVLRQALEHGAAVGLAASSVSSQIPPEVEIHPVAAAAELVAWADYLAVDLPRDSLPGLRAVLGLEAGSVPIAAAQVLVYTEMPCGGLADCGVCAVPSGRGWKLACVDGPVFTLSDVLESLETP